MKNPTAENILKKTFAHLDEVIEEKNQDSSPVADMPHETENLGERMADTLPETAGEQK